MLDIEIANRKNPEFKEISYKNEPGWYIGQYTNRLHYLNKRKELYIITPENLTFSIELCRGHSTKGKYRRLSSEEIVTIVGHN